MRSTLIPASSRVHCTTLCAAAVLLLQAGPVQAQSGETSLRRALDALSTERILADVQTLSGPSFNGRQAGTEDDLRSAQWVREEFRAAGLQLPNVPHDLLSLPSPLAEEGPGAGLMVSRIPASRVEPEPLLRLGEAEHLATAQLGTDYLPVLDAPTAALQGRIVFAGYGIVDPAEGFDDYAGVDVHNSIVLFLRGKPDYYKRPVSHADKVRFAQDRGALGYLTATGPILNMYEMRRGVTGKPGAYYGQLPPERTIPGAWIDTSVAVRLLAERSEGGAERLRTRQDRLNKTPAPQSTPTDQYAALHWKTTTQDGALANVLGTIPGTRPDTIIIGAHRDHFGRAAGLLFPGADDNASGTAIILEVARVLTKARLPSHHTILFVSFSGEERDLLGSRLYTSRPVVPLDSTKAMINVDHAGAGNGRLTVGVTGLEKRIASDAGQAVGFSEKLDLFGFFPGGDHVPFKEAGVPTLTVVSGGVHPHFHQPTDKAETINQEILETVARYVLSLTWQLAQAP